MPWKGWRGVTDHPPKYVIQGKSPKKAFKAVADEEKPYFNDNLRCHSKLAVFFYLKGGRAMKYSKRWFVVVFATLLSLPSLVVSAGTLHARDADLVPLRADPGRT
jgi:hypothetical protein